MRQPKFLRFGDTIAVVAPSMGADERHIIRYNSAVKKLRNMGYDVVCSAKVLNPTCELVSASAKERAEDFMAMYKNPDIKIIFSLGGGEIMMEILPYIDFEELKKYPPKFFVGYSDNTNLTLLLPTFLDCMSIYSYCFTSLGMEIWHDSLKDLMLLLSGQKFNFDSFLLYETESNREVGHELDSFNLTEKVEWKILSQHKSVNVSGIAMGGCLDVMSVLCGTKYDNIKELIKRYSSQGIVWFLESCDLNAISQYRSLWQLKQAGWFDNAKAIVIGRPLNTQQMFDKTYQEFNYMALQDLGIPVIIDADFGHTNPKLPIVCGANVELYVDNKTAKIEYKLRTENE